MSKGNMFLGYARGKVGDVVFYHRNGQQITRARNRNPRNPRSNAQLYQRAIMATVMQAYSWGKDIFDHSFEGKAVGEASQAYFLSQNAKILREALASDLDSQPTVHRGVLLNGPSTTTPVANLYKVSEGSLVQSFFTLQEGTQQSPTATLKTPPQQAVSQEEDETVAAYAARVGLVPGDLYTFVMFCLNETDVNVFSVPGAGVGGVQPAGSFAWVRLRVRDSVATSTASSIDSSLGDAFEVVASSNVSGSDLDTSDFADLSVDLDNFFSISNNQYRPVSMAIIRSRDDSKLRSTEFMRWTDYRVEYGLDWQYVLEGWKLGTQKVGQSDLILEGGDL